MPVVLEFTSQWWLPAFGFQRPDGQCALYEEGFAEPRGGIERKSGRWFGIRGALRCAPFLAVYFLFLSNRQGSQLPYPIVYPLASVVRLQLSS